MSEFFQQELVRQGEEHTELQRYESELRSLRCVINQVSTDYTRVFEDEELSVWNSRADLEELQSTTSMVRSELQAALRSSIIAEVALSIIVYFF